MKRIVIVALSVTLSGCVSDQLNKGLSGLVGQPIDYAVARIGYPDGQREILGDTIYVWSTSGAGMLPLTRTESTTGMIGTVPMSAVSTRTGYMAFRVSCTIQIAVTTEKIIKSWEWKGNMNACRDYARRLAR